MRTRMLLWATALVAVTVPALVAQDSRASVATSSRARPDLVILHINDFHGQVLARRFDGDPGRPPRILGGYATLVRFLAEERRRFGKDNVWVTDAGDWFQGTPEGNSDQGASIVECLNRLGLVASQIGNHEYDFGEANLVSLAKLAKHPLLGANILDANADAPTLRPYVRPFVVLEHGGVRIALLGLVTKDTKSVSTGPFGAAVFADEEQTVERLLPEVRRAADAVILMTHCGLATDRNLAKRFPDLLLILGGHSHDVLRPGVREGAVHIVQAGSKGAGVTRVELALDREGRRATVLSTRLEDLDADRIGTDPEAEEFVTERFGAISAAWDQEVGRIEGDVGSGRRTPNSTAAGNLIADLIRETAGADVGLTNKGGLRTALQAGSISRRQVYQLVPFENSVVAFQMTGAQLRGLLQQSLASGRQPLEISGATYGYAIESGARVLRELEIGGQRVDEAKSYKVATNSFLADGGDGITAFAAATRLPQTSIMRTFLRDLLLEKLRSQSTLKVSAEGRIRALR